MKLVVIWFALLLMVAAVPMALRKVPPNGLYGLRTPKTMSNAEIWYAANQKAGVNLLAASLLTLGIVGLVAMKMGAMEANIVGLPVLVVLTLVSCGVSLLQLRGM